MYIPRRKTQIYMIGYLILKIHRVNREFSRYFSMIRETIGMYKHLQIRNTKDTLRRVLGILYRIRIAFVVCCYQLWFWFGVTLTAFRRILHTYYLMSGMGVGVSRARDCTPSSLIRICEGFGTHRLLTNASQSD